MKKEKFSYVIVFLIIFIIITFIFNINIFIYLKNIIWALSSVMIITSGLFFSFKTKFKQLHFKKMFSCFKNQNDKNGINTISSLTMSLAGRIGVGSLAGVALAIYLGGVGSIFWMWVVSLIASSTTYVEGVLGVIYKTKNIWTSLKVLKLYYKKIEGVPIRYNRREKYYYGIKFC